jgi:hypothetical protein
LTGEMDYNQKYLTQFSYAKRLILLNDKSETDTLGEIVRNMVKFSDFRRKSNVYQTLVNSGEIIIIKNYNITDRLQRLEENYNYINRLEENHSTIIMSKIIPDIVQIIRFDPLKVEAPGILFSYKFQNNFDMLIVLMIEKKEAYEKAKNEINSIIKLIDQQLND